MNTRIEAIDKYLRNSQKRFRINNDDFAKAVISARFLYEEICAIILKVKFDKNLSAGKDVNDSFKKLIISPYIHNHESKLAGETIELFSRFHETTSLLFHYNELNQKKEVEVFDFCLNDLLSICRWFVEWCEANSQECFFTKAEVESLSSKVCKCDMLEIDRTSKIKINWTILDQYISYLCNNSESFESDILAFYVRKAVECMCSQKLIQISREKSVGSITLDQYCTKLSSNHAYESEPKEGHYTSDVLNILRTVQSVCNPMLHWNEKKTTIDGRRKQELKTITELLLEYTINEEFSKNYPYITELIKQEASSAKKYRNRLRVLRISLIASVASILVIVICVISKSITITKYYHDYVLLYGKPIGINEIDKEEISQCTEYYMFKIKNGNVIELSVRNKYGAITDSQGYYKNYFNFSPLSKFEYIGDRVANVFCYDRFGSLKAIKQYNSNNTVMRIQDPSDQMQQVYYKSDMHMFSTRNDPSLYLWEAEDGKEERSQINEFHISYKEDGTENSIRFYRDGYPVYDANGLSGYDYVYENFQLSSAHCVYNNNITEEDKLDFYLFEYDAKGNLIVEGLSYTDLNHKREYYSRVCKDYVLESEFKLNCEITTDIDKLFPAIQPTDERDTIDRSSLTDIQRSVDEVVFYSYEEGNKLITTLNNGDGEYIDNQEGWCRRESIYDDLGRLIEESYYDRSGNPTININTFISRKLITYVDDPNLQGAKYGYILDQYTNTQLGLCEFAWGYNANKAGFYFDKYGNMIYRVYYDNDGNYSANFDGVTYEKYVYIGKRLSTILYYDLQWNQMPKTGNIYSIEKEFDKRGNVEAIRYFGKNRTKITGPNGFHAALYVYDINNHIVDKKFYNVRMNYVNLEYPGLENGLCREIREFDDRGRIILYKAYFTIDGKTLIMSLDDYGIYMLKWNYFSDGMSYSIEYHREPIDDSGYTRGDGKYNDIKITDLLGVHEVRYDYSPSENLYYVQYLDINSEKIKFKLTGRDDISICTDVYYSSFSPDISDLHQNDRNHFLTDGCNLLDYDKNVLATSSQIKSICEKTNDLKLWNDLIASLDKWYETNYLQ